MNEDGHDAATTAAEQPAPWPHVPAHLLALVDQFEPFLTNTGGNNPRALLNELGDPSNPRMAATNVVRFTLAAAVLAQVQLLDRLHAAGALGAATRCATVLAQVQLLDRLHASGALGCGACHPAETHRSPR